MKEIARFEIDSASDRSAVCAILSTNGYPVVVKHEYNDSSISIYKGSYVVVYEKEDK